MNEQQPTPYGERQPAPVIEQPVAAVSEYPVAAPPPPAEPKPAPTRPDSRLAVAPVPPQRQAWMLRRMTRTSAVWLITVPGTILFLVLAALELCTTPQEIGQAALSFMLVLVLSLLWVLLVKLLRGSRPTPPAIWSEVRINELHPQGAVSRGESGTLVLPFEDVTLYEESEDWLMLYGPGGVILWSANDLTPPAATAIQLYLRARVPTASIQIKEVFRARGERLLPLPTLPRRGACLATATADTRAWKLAILRMAQALVRCVPLMWMLAMGVALLLNATFRFDIPVLNHPWVWFVGLSIVEAVAMFGLIWWDAATRKTKPFSTPEFSFCEDGMWVSTGRGAIRFARGSVPVTRLSKSLDLRLPSGSVRLPFQNMSDKDLVFRYFDLSL